MSISSLAYILLFQHLLAFKFGWFEISGYEYGFPNFLYYVSLPIIIWVILSLGPDIRFYRTLILDEIYQDYVRTARAKGLSERVILLKHVLRNAMIPIVTIIGLMFGSIITGAILTETIFSWPGIGKWFVASVNARDYPVIQGAVLFIATMVVVINMFVDLVYAFINPKMR